MTAIADLFELPERVHQADFVARLSEGVERASPSTICAGGYRPGPSAGENIERILDGIEQ